jgi:hypothetical protein
MIKKFNQFISEEISTETALNAARKASYIPGRREQSGRIMKLTSDQISRESGYPSDKVKISPNGNIVIYLTKTGMTPVITYQVRDDSFICEIDQQQGYSIDRKSANQILKIVKSVNPNTKIKTLSDLSGAIISGGKGAKISIQF